ncbi:MAG: transcription initiation factor IIF auxiliary subunit [Dokdonia sp.]|jgi:transcription initiation factor IIF auxiliary subunit
MNNLRLRNKWEYKGNNRWNWGVFIDDDNSGKLKDITFVEYVLHPSFPNPRRIEKNQKENFIHWTNGWGVFLVKAFVHTKSGKRIKLEHHLELKHEPIKGESN